MSGKKKLQNYLKLAAEVCSLAEYFAKEISSQLQTRHQNLNHQERVLIGLALKMYHAFESLVEDAKRERAEAIHHLKTLVESFIYLYWVGEESGDNKKARIVLAKACNEKVKFFKNNQLIFLGYTNPPFVLISCSITSPMPRTSTKPKYIPLNEYLE